MPQTFQPPDQGAAHSVDVDPIKVIRTKFPVVFLALEHVKRNDQERMGYGHDGTFSSPPGGNAPIQCREVVVLHHGDGPSRLRQTTAERHISLAQPPAQTFPGALEIPWTETSPGSEVRRGRKLIHIQPDLRQQSPSGHAVHPGDGTQPRDLTLKRAHAPLDLFLELFLFRFGEAQMIVELLEQKAVMLGHVTFERQLQWIFPKPPEYRSLPKPA